MILATMGVSGEMSIQPTAVPPDFIPRPRGRPRKDGSMPGADEEEE